MGLVVYLTTERSKGVVLMEELMRMFTYSRTSTLILLKKIDEDKWDIQPEGFPNTVRWNAGHVFCTAEEYLHDADSAYEMTNPEWNDLFLDGTRPSEWPEDVPSPAEIKAALKEQDKRIMDYFSDKLANNVSTVRDVNGWDLETVQASMQFVTWHEGIHLGFTNGLSKVLL